LHRVSGERLRSELALIFGEPRFTDMMARLSGLGLLAAIHPSLFWDDWLAERLEGARSFRPDPAWRLAASPPAEALLYLLWSIRLEPAQASEVGERLRLPRLWIAAMRSAAELRRNQAAWAQTPTLSRRVRLLSAHPEMALLAVWIAESEDPIPRASIESYLAHLRFVEPRLDGNALRQRGLPPGPVYARILGALQDAWVDGEVVDEAGEARLLEALLAEEGGDG